jgi:hypothetical protein
LEKFSAPAFQEAKSNQAAFFVGGFESFPLNMSIDPHKKIKNETTITTLLVYWFINFELIVKTVDE